MDQTMAANAQKNKFLIDGFPRNQDNLQGWNKTMDGKADVSFVLFFDCNNEVMKIFICQHGLLNSWWSTVREKESDLFYLHLHFILATVFFELVRWMDRTALSYC